MQRQGPGTAAQSGSASSGCSVSFPLVPQSSRKPVCGEDPHVIINFYYVIRDPRFDSGLKAVRSPRHPCAALIHRKAPASPATLAFVSAVTTELSHKGRKHVLRDVGWCGLRGPLRGSRGASGGVAHALRTTNDNRATGGHQTSRGMPT